MTNAPERIWIEDEFGDGDEDQWTYGTWDVRNYRGYVVEYVRADIVQALTAERNKAVLGNHRFNEHEPTWAELTSDWKARAEAAEAERDRLRSLLAKAASDLTAYVDAEYPPDTCAQYPDIARRHHRDMDLVRRIEAELRGETP